MQLVAIDDHACRDVRHAHPITNQEDDVFGKGEEAVGFSFADLSSSKASAAKKMIQANAKMRFISGCLNE